MLKIDIFTGIDIEPGKLKVSENSILSMLGYGENTAEPFVIETIKHCIDESFNLVSPTGGFIIKPIHDLISKEGLLIINNTTLHIQKIISAQLKYADFVAIFYTTIGKGVENKSTQFFNEGNMLEGYIYNLIGSEMAESAAEYIHQIIKIEAFQDEYQITNRFSPGYCNWNVNEQFKIFDFFPADFNDISLTESALMNPVKSVSGIIGVGKKVKFNPYKCKFCEDKKCIYRRQNEGQDKGFSN